MISYIATVFIVDMVLLLAAGGYGFFCAITNPNQYINSSLCGRRAKVAVFVPFLCFTTSLPMQRRCMNIFRLWCGMFLMIFLLTLPCAKVWAW